MPQMIRIFVRWGGEGGHHDNQNCEYLDSLQELQAASARCRAAVCRALRIASVDGGASAGIVTMGGSHSAVPTIPETERRPRLLRRGVPRVAGDSALLFSFDGIIRVIGYSRIIFKQISSALISSIGTVTRGCGGLK